jgi:outer membrane protein TolC
MAMAAVADSTLAGGDSLLQEYILESLDHHPNLNSMQAMIQAQEARARMAGSWMNPNLMFGIMNLPTSLDFHEEGMTAVEIGFMQRIPFPGKLSAAKREQLAQAEASQSDYAQMKLTMISMVRMAYYELAGNLGIRSALEEGRQRTADILSSAKIMAGSGMGSQADILRAQLEYDQWSKRLIESDRRVADSRSKLAAALGRNTTDDLNDPLALSSPAKIPPLTSLTGTELENTPSRQSQEAKVKAAEFRLKRSRMDYWPDVDLTFKYGLRGYLKPSAEALAMGFTESMPQNNMLSLQASFPIPLFAHGNQNAIVQENQAMLARAQAENASGAIKLRDEVRQAYDRLRAALSTYTLIADTLLPDAEAAFRASLPIYQTGKLPFMTLNEAQMQVVMQKMDLVMALSDVYMARADLERLLGRGL